MALDPLERERLRRKMADRMAAFGNQISCVSSHYYDEVRLCELCGDTHAHELLVVKNRANRKMHVALSCLKEMIRFKVTDVEDLSRWMEKLSELRVEHEKRKAVLELQRQEERKRLEKKVIVRRKGPGEGNSNGSRSPH